MNQFTEAAPFQQWVGVVLFIGGCAGTIRYECAHELAPVMMICFPIAWSLYCHEGRRQPLLIRNRKDRA